MIDHPHTTSEAAARAALLHLGILGLLSQHQGAVQAMAKLSALELAIANIRSLSHAAMIVMESVDPWPGGGAAMAVTEQIGRLADDAEALREAAYFDLGPLPRVAAG